jgi:hypothetical protein
VRLTNLRLVNLFLATAFVLSAGSVLAGQTKQEKAQARFDQAAKGFIRHGGLVNVVDGEAGCMCGNGSASALRAKQEVRSGDTIKVGAGRVEILLNPGYYLRLGPHTEARLVDLTPGNLKIKLSSGAAIIEIAVDANGGTWLREMANRVFDIVMLSTPRDEYAICRAGAYRLDIVSAEESRIGVLKGRVVVAGTMLDDGRTASVVSGRVNVAAHEDATADSFDTWSRERAAGLVQSNKSLKRLEWYKEMQDGNVYLDSTEDVTSDSGSARTISARNGLITFVENGSILKNGNQAWEVLETGGSLSDGDRVRTETDSRAEIHPYPDFYLFMNGNSEILFAEPEDDDVSITVIKGSVVVVVAEMSVKASERNSLKMIAGDASFDIGKRGFYHVNRPGADVVEMLIYDGVVKLNSSEISARKKMIVSGSNLTRSSLDKDAQNSFDVWSDRRVMRNLVSPTRRRIWFAGAWYLNPLVDEYTFVPGDRECKSPYGGDYVVTYRIRSSRRFRRVDAQPTAGVRTSPVSRPRIMKSPFLGN